MVTPKLRSLALSLHFYSPADYKYVRQTFDKCLPHPSTLRKWYSSVDGSPGFTSESLNAVKSKVKEIQLKNKTLFYGLIMDEMSIMEDVHYNGERLQNYINFGCGMGVVDDCDALPRAKEALVFLIISSP